MDFVINDVGQGMTIDNDLKPYDYLKKDWH